MRINHLIGGILLVAGTSIGAGMLAIPVGTGFMGFFPSLILFSVCWMFFLITAIFFIDVNASVKVNSNLITMADKTLGIVGKGFTWVVYLLLLYALTAAYIAGSAPLFQAFFSSLFHINVPINVCYFALPVVFGFFVYLGTTGVDMANRILMGGLVIAYIGLVLFVPSHIQLPLLMHHDFPSGIVGLSIVITSFGYHIIIPTLSTYLKHDRKQLITTVVIGSLITLFVYVVWQFLVLGVVPLTGKVSIAHTWFVEGGSAAKPLAQIIKHPLVGITAIFFSFFAIVTSFLGVSLSLADFVTDGFKLKMSWEGRVIACLLTFIPPVFFVFAYPRGFILALDYAGIFVILLLGLLPAAMAWKLKSHRFYNSLLGKILIVAIVIISIGVIVLDVLNHLGYGQKFIFSYRG
ncbi:MAG: tyrosine transporter [Chlamydiales bacterium]|nr:tyrosine transporter [Chlamydiales bacterium]